MYSSLMRKPLLAVAAALMCGSLSAQTPSMFAPGPKAPNVHHTGEVWLSRIAAATDTFPYGMTVANMAPGARLNWHSHPEGQRLLVTEGVGYYHQRGESARVMGPGDVLECPPGVEHWHSASPDTGVVYVALYTGGDTQWGAPVTDEEYYSAGQ